MRNNTHLFFKGLIFLFIVILFCYFRLKPLYFQTVGYTFDQGRDFLKAANIVLNKKLAFIGPTTGIPGVFHGVWWYYILVIPFILFGGSPIGYYYFNFFLHLCSFLLFAYFLNKYFGFLASLVFCLIIATSPYFIFTSIFVGNNIMVMSTLLLFLITNYYLIKEKPLFNLKAHLFLCGLLLGFLTEFELAFGMFLIPSYIISVLLDKNLKSVFRKINNVAYFILGLVIPFIPRVLFELKNHFLQTKTLLLNFVHPTAQNPNSYSGALQDRAGLFVGYYRSLFASDAILLFYTIILIYLVLRLISDKEKILDTALTFFYSLLALLFLFSIFNKDSFFWGNYYEGIQYLFLFILAIFFSIKSKSTSFLWAIIKVSFVVLLSFTSVNLFLKEVRQKPLNQGNLKGQIEIVNYIQSNEKNKNNYCVKIYTPPVIPYTYNYLFLYSHISKKISIPQNDWIDNKCWAIIEPDSFKERQEKWMKDNIPPKSKIIKKYVNNDTEVILYEK